MRFNYTTCLSSYLSSRCGSVKNKNLISSWNLLEFASLPLNRPIRTRIQHSFAVFFVFLSVPEPLVLGYNHCCFHNNRKSFAKICCFHNNCKLFALLCYFSVSSTLGRLVQLTESTNRQKQKQTNDHLRQGWNSTGEQKACSCCLWKQQIFAKDLRLLWKQAIRGYSDRQVVHDGTNRINIDISTERPSNGDCLVTCALRLGLVSPSGSSHILIILLIYIWYYMLTAYHNFIVHCFYICFTLYQLIL